MTPEPDLGFQHPPRAARRRDATVLAPRGDARRPAAAGELPPEERIGLRGQRPAVVARGLLLIALMAIGSVVMWLGAPAGWLWLASQMGEVGNPTIGPLLLIAVGLPISMVVIAIALRRLDRRFADITGINRENRRVQLPWLRSMRGERDSGRRTSILDVVMIGSVTVAGLLFLVWFFGFAHPGLPH